MAAPFSPYVDMPPGDFAAILMAWDETAGKFLPLSSTANALNVIAVVVTEGPDAGAITSVDDEISSTTILAANTGRLGATFFNDSTATLYLALANTTASTTNYSLQIPANGYYELPVSKGGPYTGIIVGIWSSDAGGSVKVTELT